jgi:ribosome biogenesis protein BMS1
MKAQKAQTYMQKRAVVLEPEEKKAIAMLQQIRALRKDQVTRRKEKQAERKEVYKKKVTKVDWLKTEARTAERKEKRKREARSPNPDGLGEGGGRSKKKQKT